MHNVFIKAKFGLVPSTLTPLIINGHEQVLISYIKTCNNVTGQYDVESSIEVYRIAQQFIGSDFRLWLMANFANGSGARAPLIRTIVNWVEGKCSGRMVMGTVRRDMARLNFLDSYEDKLRDPINNNLDVKKYVDNVDFSCIRQRHFYAFLLLLGPELVAHFCLSLDGIRYQ